MANVTVVYVKRRGPRTIAKVTPKVEVSRPVKDNYTLEHELRQARIISRPHLCSSVYKWGR